MLDILNYSFMIRALLAGGMIGVIAPLIGSFLVAKRYSLMADSLAHVSLAGIAIGLLLGIYPLLTAIATAIIVALVIERLRTAKRASGEIALAIFLSGGLALAVVLIGLGRGFNVDLLSYLFGSITTVTETDLVITGILGLISVFSVGLLYKELVYVSFDEETALVSGVPTRLINTWLMILTAMTVTLAMRIVGVLLIGALMVIPVATAMQFKRSFKQTLALAVGSSLISVVGGLWLSYYLDLASGGTIVMTSLGLFAISLGLKKLI